MSGVLILSFPSVPGSPSLVSGEELPLTSVACQLPLLAPALGALCYGLST